MNAHYPPPDIVDASIETSTPINPAQGHLAGRENGGRAGVRKSPGIGDNSSPIALDSSPEWTLVATAYESAMPSALTIKRTGSAHPSFYCVSKFSKQAGEQPLWNQEQEPAASGPAPGLEPGRARRGSWVAAKFWDPRTPYVLLLYLQLFFNISIVSLVLVLLYRFVTTVQADVHGKVESYTLDAVREISRCLREYFRNKCSLEVRAPALEQTCTAWENCMNRDPQQLGRSRITAETFAQIVDGFLRPISWKALVFFTLLTFGALVATNIGFGSYRRYAREDSRRVAWLEEQLHTLQEELLSRDPSRVLVQSRELSHVPQLSREQVLAASTPFQQPPGRFLNSSMLANDSPLSGKERRF